MFQNWKRRINRSKKVRKFCNYLAEEIERGALRSHVLDLAGLALDSKPAVLVSETFDNEKLEEIADLLGKKVVYSPFNKQYLIGDENSIENVSKIAFDGDFCSPPKEEVEYAKKRLAYLEVDMNGLDIEDLMKRDRELTESRLRDIPPNLFPPISEKLKKEEHQSLGEIFGIPKKDIDDFNRTFDVDSTQIQYSALGHVVQEKNYVDDAIDELRQQKIWSVSPKLAKALGLRRGKSRERAKKRFGRYLLNNISEIENPVELLSVGLAERPLYVGILEKEGIYRKLRKKAEKCGLYAEQSGKKIVVAKNPGIIEKFKETGISKIEYRPGYESDFVRDLRKRCFAHYLGAKSSDLV